MYTQAQQAFAFSMMVGGDANTTGTAEQLEQALATSINSYLTTSGLIELIGQWSLVWGPCVFQSSGSTAADNTMLVAANSDLTAYLVAIAGTNPSSQYDLVEDLTVNPTTPWTYGGEANIATGTNDGLTALLGMTYPTTGVTLSSYLGSVPDSGSATLLFAGHSLGGALSPALALALFNSVGGVLASSAWSGVDVCPTAGPTAGDQGFANLFGSTFPASNGANTNSWNTLDLIPHAWAPSTFTTSILENIYAPKLAASACIQTLIGGLVALPPEQNPYVQIPNQSFAGAYQSHWFADKTCEFLAEIVYQHIYAYYEQLTPELISILNPMNPYSISGQSQIGAICTEIESKYC